MAVNGLNSKMNQIQLARRAKQVRASLAVGPVAKPILVANNVEKIKKDKKMANTVNISVRKSGYDTSHGLTKVTVEKQADFTAPSDLAEAQKMLNGDSAKLMEVVVSGMRSIFREQLEANDAAPWFDVVDGKISTTEFKGNMLADSAYDSLTAQVLNLAKTSARPFGSWDSKSATEKSALKAKARNTILANPAIFGFDFVAVSEEDAAKIED